MRLIDADALKFLPDKYRRMTVVAARCNGKEILSTALRILQGVQGAIDAAPTIDAVPVVHARWLYDRPQHYKCSACKSMWGELMKRMAHFCPNCGAKMDA